jgi:hypothetical protein
MNGTWNRTRQLGEHICNTSNGQGMSSGWAVSRREPENESMGRDISTDGILSGDWSDP